MFDGIFKQIQGWVKLKGATDSTLIGNDGDALRITSKPNGLPTDPRPPFDLMWHSAFLKEGSNVDMNVDGSTTPVSYIYTPPLTGQIHYITRLLFEIDDNGNTSNDGFGSLSALTNGIDIKIKIDGSTHTFANIKTNSDLVMICSHTHHTQSTGGFIQGNYFSGAFDMKPDMTLKESRGDQIEVVVNDDLRGLLHLKFSIAYWHTLGI